MACWKNIASPQSVEEQIKEFDGAPEEYINIFHVEHAKLQGEEFENLRYCTKNEVAMIIEQLKSPKEILEFNQPIPGKFNVLIKKFEDLISKGDEYSEKFRNRLIIGFKPVLTKWCKPNPEGTPPLQVRKFNDLEWSTIEFN